MNPTVSNIQCSVSNCSYYSQNKCVASNIQVNAMGDKVANTKEGTCCETFKTK